MPRRPFGTAARRPRPPRAGAGSRRGRRAPPRLRPPRGRSGARTCPRPRRNTISPCPAVLAMIESPAGAGPFDSCLVHQSPMLARREPSGRQALRLRPAGSPEWAWEGVANIRRFAMERTRPEVDLALLLRIATRDEAALAGFYDRHCRLAYSVILRIL